MSATSENLKLSFEQAILKIPKYQLEPSLYTALMTKMEHNPLKMCWESNDLIIHTIGKGVCQDVINVHSKPLRTFVGLLESKRFLGDYKLNPYKFSTNFKDPENADDVGFMLKSVDLQLAQGPIDNFHVDIDSQFKSQYLKFQRSLTSLSPTGCPHISYEGNEPGPQPCFVQDLKVFHKFTLTFS